MVPVGEDQRQHVELVGYVSRAFNEAFCCDLFASDFSIGIYSSAKIMSLRNPSVKMSKSADHPKATLSLFEDPADIFDKIRHSLTDSASNYISYDVESRPGLANLIDIYSNVVGRPVARIVEECGGIGIVQFKKNMAEELVEALKPFRERFHYLMGHKDHLEAVLEAGNEKARQVAQDTMDRVRFNVGL
ncbi:tryptophan--tRNA ligase 2-like [Octopus sinensis]|uniref:tryptophan--tRNA ligase n=1 Tax=Octopus sinensis TaxID=2607531 RepID=A0A6P7TS75_9MOLL|nr:tryptophan--tRNA ligase 2-like [Octopus sinensis]